MPFTQVISGQNIQDVTDSVNLALTALFKSGYTAHVSLGFDEQVGEVFAVLEPVVFATKQLLFGTTRDEKQYQLNGIYGKGAARSHGWLLVDGEPLFYGTK